jgi:hypothetical protein
VAKLEENAQVNSLKNFISLGPHCCMRLRIKNQMEIHGFESGPTSFFDYNLCDENTLSKILRLCKIEDYFNKENIEYIRTSENHNHAHVNLKNIYFKSIHDVKNCEGIELENEIKNYIERYKRRYHRLVSRISSRDDIVFVYMGKISDENTAAIEDGIKKISKKKVPIICLNDLGKESPDVKQKGMVFDVNYSKFYERAPGGEPSINWIWMNFLDWEGIFKVLMNIHNETKIRTKKAFL